MNGELSYVPLQENIDDNLLDSYEELKAKWESMKWLYSYTVELNCVEREIENPDDQVKCDENYIWLFKSEARLADWYWGPFDETPQTFYFLNQVSMDGMYGYEYSKDFDFFTCLACGRTICKQNPSNGWMVQYKQGEDGECECNKCVEEYLLVEGIDLDYALENNSLRDGLFMNSGELESAGWEQTEVSGAMIGSGRSEHSDGSVIWNKLQEIQESGMKAFVEIDSMAIGGMGGYVTIWQKQ